jgi:hypothetical protein
VREARAAQDCAENCFSIVDDNSVACFVACSEKYPYGRSLQYTPEKVKPTTSVREARDLDECIDNCYAIYGDDIRDSGCVLECGTNLGRSL